MQYIQMREIGHMKKTRICEVTAHIGTDLRSSASGISDLWPLPRAGCGFYTSPVWKLLRRASWGSARDKWHIKPDRFMMHSDFYLVIYMSSCVHTHCQRQCRDNPVWTTTLSDRFPKTRHPNKNAPKMQIVPGLGLDKFPYSDRAQAGAACCLPAPD